MAILNLEILCLNTGVGSPTISGMFPGIEFIAVWHVQFLSEMSESITERILTKVIRTGFAAFAHHIVMFRVFVQLIMFSKFSQEYDRYSWKPLKIGFCTNSIHTEADPHK
jgi:hypothetical protein